MNFLDSSKKKISAVVILLIVVILGSWVLLKGDSRANREQITLSPEDNGKTMKVTDETEIVLELPENPTTGYTWKISKGRDMLNLLENKYIPPKNQLPGGGGLRKLKFTVTDSGKLLMLYTKSWENRVENNFVINFQL